MSARNEHTVFILIRLVLASVYLVVSTGILYLAVPAQSPHFLARAPSQPTSCSSHTGKECPKNGTCARDCCCHQARKTPLLTQLDKTNPSELTGPKTRTVLRARSRCPDPFGSSSALFHTNIQPHLFYPALSAPPAPISETVAFDADPVFSVFIDPPSKIPIAPT